MHAVMSKHGCQASRSGVLGWLPASRHKVQTPGGPDMLVSRRGGAPVSAASFPFQMLGGVLVVTAPAEIDITAADQLQAILFDLRARGHTTVVVDMTGTQFCDPAGIFELALAHQRVQADGGGLRLVMPAASAVLRVFTMTGLDRLVPCYASRDDALSRAIAAGVWNAHAPGRATAPVRERGPGEVA